MSQKQLSSKSLSETNQAKLTFRAKALENISSSEIFRQRLSVRSLTPWFALSVLGTIVFAILLWSIFGKIPVTVQGQGILLRPREAPGKPLELSNFVAPGEGRIDQILVQEGDQVQAGQVLGLIDQPDLKLQLRNKNRELKQLRDQQDALAGLESESKDLTQRAILIKKQTIKAEIKSLQERASFIRNTKLKSLKVQYQGLNSQLNRMKALVDLQETKVSRTEPLVKEGAISESSFIEIKEEAIRSENTLSQIQSDIEKVDVEITTAKEEYQNTIDRIAELGAQINELDSQFINVNLQDQTRNEERKLKIESVKGEISLLELTLRQRSQIISPYSGIILDMLVSEGQIVQLGTPAGQIQLNRSPSVPLTALMYFTPGDGKKVVPGMKVSVTPDTVKREEHGGINGRVLSVTPYPVSEQSAQEYTGDKTIAEALTEKGRKIEAIIRLEADPKTPSGYIWTASKGPNFKITSGSIATGYVTLEENPPITYVLPILRKWTGLY
ncbi:hypothetical protein DO97_02795 [Neosynechococcus sphagnicola sy1]|uniref:Multidrug resistance protein MdtA-like barrel-sandwich hybrid domain-containing protein n=1 Tax=Neosynechococcus sphagnicola sy1 TaxID=1497020 RepID=A0A098TMA8_9CYAN|nr:NHLP bacteriocin system secretion protein [Neosynechococcus sphagnicola]KGF72997.1 hypothetical protein DO97_02795 [Neosynechococcus sphagnicola sy1]